MFYAHTHTDSHLFALVSQGGVAFAQQNKQKEATIVTGMTAEIDFKGKAVILTPRTQSGVLEPLAIPISGANLLVKTLQAKIAEPRPLLLSSRSGRRSSHNRSRRLPLGHWLNRPSAQGH